MTENKNFCVSALYDLLKDDGINIRWEGSKIHLYRPGGLSNLHKIAFRNFKGELQPFSNMDLPELKCDVMIMSNGLNTIDYTGTPTFEMTGKITYDDTKLNKIFTINKGWSHYEESEDGDLTENIKELFGLVNNALNDYFKKDGFMDVFDMSDLSYWSPLHNFTLYKDGSEVALNNSFSPLIVDNQKNIYYYDSSDSSIKSFTLSDDYFKGYPCFDGTGNDLIIGFKNNVGGSSYDMNIYYGTAESDITKINYITLPYCDCDEAFRGYGGGTGKYYNNYIINYVFNDPSKITTLLTTLINPSSNVYQLKLFSVCSGVQTTATIDLMDQSLASYLTNTQILIGSGKITGIYLMGWSSTINTSVNSNPIQNNLCNLLMCFKMVDGDNVFYFPWIGELTLTYTTGGFTINTIKEGGIWHQHNIRSYDNFYLNFASCFNGPLILSGDIKVWAGGAVGTLTPILLSWQFIGLGQIRIMTEDQNPDRNDFTRYYNYCSNILDGYFNDGHKHCLSFIRSTSSSSDPNKIMYYRAFDINTDYYNVGITYFTWHEINGDYYLNNNVYGQFLGGGPIMFYNVVNPSENQAVRVQTVNKLNVKSVGVVSTNDKYLNPRCDDYLTVHDHFNPFILTSLDVSNEITGKAYIPVISYQDDYKACVVMRIYTDPYYFEVRTDPTFDNIIDAYNMDGVLTDLLYRASNNDILKIMEYLILLRYNNNNIILKCANFSNNDGSIFNINDESRIDFKAMITDNTQQEIVITLEGNDGTQITYDLLKEIYAHCCVSVDWIQ